MEKFLNEARTLASFNSMEGIIWVKDFFYANSTAYIIMEYVEGINVKEYVRQNGEMKSARVLEVMRPILLSLEKIHRLGLIHRDISPENIVINREGNTYLVDFGITRPYTGEDFKTITVFFKRGYAAEEQYRERGEQGPAVIIFIKVSMQNHPVGCCQICYSLCYPAFSGKQIDIMSIGLVMCGGVRHLIEIIHGEDEVHVRLFRIFAEFYENKFNFYGGTIKRNRH